MKCKIFTFITMFFALAITAGAQSFERQWDQSNATESRPTWLTGFTNRGIASTPEFVFIASRSPELNDDNKTVMYLDPKTGEMLGTLNVDPIELGPFAVNDVATSDDGQIFVSNLALYHEKWVTDGTWQFKVYKWSNVSAVPEVFIDYDNPEQLRLGDLITVKGDPTKDAVIYSAVSGSPKVVRWEVVDGVLNETPDIIELQGTAEEDGFGFPKVIPTGVTKSDPFYYNATKTALKKFSADGATILEEIVPANFLPSNGVEGRDNSITHFMVEDQSYIAALSIQGTGASNPAEVKAVNVTNGLNMAMDPFYSASLGTADNTQLNGDITSTVIDGEVWVFLLYSQSGFAAYKYIAPLPEVVVPVTESGWRRGSNPTLDSIGGRISRPDWLNQNSRAVAVGNGHIYVVNCAPEKGPGEILVLDATDGSYLNKKLDVAAVNEANSTSDLRISDVEVDDAGHILACNMRLGDAFNVFAWDDEESEPYLLVSANEIPYADAGDEGVWQQTAYYFDVKGDIKGDAVIVAARSNLKVTYRWVITGGVVQNDGVPTVVVNEVTTGLSGHFGPYASAALESADPNSAIWVNGLSINPIRLGADGSSLGAIPDSVATNITQNVAATMVTKYFEWDSKKYLLEYNWVWADHVRLIDVSAEDLSTLTLADQKEVGFYLGQEPNGLKWGDVDYCIAEDGSLNIVTLVTNNGIRLDRIEAAGTPGKNITYELNGGVTNDKGWANKNDMYMGLNEAWNTFSETTTTWKSLDELIAEADGDAANAVPKGIPTQAGAMDVTFIQDDAVKAEWQWLVDYMDAACTAQGKTLPSTSGAYLRYNLSAFFLSSVRPGWPASADYAVLGQPDAFIPAWKHAFAGPDTYEGTVEVIIPSPYKEGFTFDGWYDNAEFTGTKVTSIPVGAEGDKKFYAKWVEYIPTVKEVVALGAGKATKATGIVTFIDGTTVYLQDATGGLKVEFTTAPDVAAGNVITLSGTTAALGKFITVTGATFLTKETATLPAIQTVTLPTLAEDSAAYMFEYVLLEGLTIQSYESGSVTLRDDAENTITLLADLNQSTFPVNTKVNLKVVVSCDTKTVLVGDPANVTAAPVARPDPATYAALEEGKYTLTSKWLVSNNMDNLSANPIGNTGFVRGMTAKDGIMYFIDREHKQLTRVDGATGEKLAPIKLASNIFTYTGRNKADTADSTYVAGTLPFNDIKIDGAGNVLLGNLITSNAQPFQVWKVDLITGEGELIVHEILKENYDFAEATIRFDAFGVYGDVDGDAIIMAMNASGMEAYKWTISGGVAGDAEAILIDTSEEGTYLTGLPNPGYAPQIFPMDENYFYIDGWSTLPTLIDMDGNVVDGFYNDTSEDWTVAASAKQGHNGLIEFSVGDDHFFLMAYTNTVGTPPSSFRLFKWADANKEFKDIQSLWILPEDGMGAASNAYRTAVPSVEVDEEEGVATIYLYTGENGYGVYELKVGTPNSAPIDINQELLNVIVREKTLNFNQQLEFVAVYSVTGQLVVQAKQTSAVEVPQSGIYIVRAKTLDGELAVRKVVVMN